MFGKLLGIQRVTRDDYGDAWPLTVDEGWLRRYPQDGSVAIRVDGTDYALTGAAKRHGAVDVEPIHAPNLNIPPIPNDDGTGHRLRKSLRPLIRAAQQL